MKNPLTPAGIEPSTFRFVAQHLNHSATAVPPPTKIDNEMKYNIFCEKSYVWNRIFLETVTDTYFGYIYRVIQNDCQGTIVQRQFRTKFRKQPPSDNSIRRWYAQFQETGCLCIPELKVRIRTAIETITADMRNELDYRVDVCRITKGPHIEHL